MRPLILVVESSQALRQALRPWLAALFPQCRVILARTGTGGIRAARAHDPFIVVIDVRLPHMNGIEAARRIKAHAPGANVVMFTHCDADPYRAAAIRAGACGYVLKQMAGKELPRLLERLLNDEAARRTDGAAAHPVVTNEPG